jgi:uncharacterized protein
MQASASASGLLDRLGLRDPRMRIWMACAATVLLVWLLLVTAFGYGRVAAAHWPISVVMILGSLVAGSTPLGGGTVAFPFLVLVFHQPAKLGRNFGFAIQALGMTSALIFMFCRRLPIQVKLLFWNSVGAAIGLVCGTLLVQPLVSDKIAKLLFASLWMSFGVLTIVKNREFCALDQKPFLDTGACIQFGLTVGIIGGLAAALIGVGLDMLTYVALVLLFRSDLKLAIPAAVCSMALASILALGLHLALGDVEPEVFFNWLAAAPIVVFGAPAGTLLVTILPRVRTLYVVAALCLVQFIWTLHQTAPTGAERTFVAVVLSAALGIFMVLFQVGKRTQGPSTALPARLEGTSKAFRAGRPPRS